MSAPAAAPRVAVVGCGHWGKNLVRNFAELGHLEAIVDAHAPTVAALTAKFGGRAMGFEEVLADRSIDGVAIAAPAVLHHVLASRALEAGKHVFVEKPLSLEVHDAESLVALADRRDRRLMVGHLMQYHPAFRALKKIVDGGAVGRLTYVYSNRLALGKVRLEEDVLWSFAPHDLSMILAIVGEAPERVAAFAAPTLHPAIGDTCQVHMSFRNGVQGHVFASWLHPFKEQRLVVIGERGMAMFEDSHPDPAKKLLLFPHRIDWINGVPNPVKGEAEAIPFEPGEPLRLECAHFLECIATGATPLTDGREGVRVVSVLAQATAALKSSAPPAAVAPAPPKVAKSYPGVSIHESAYVDAGVEIGAGTRIWHFSHVLGEVSIGRKVNIGQNVVVGPRATIGDNVKIQNNVSVYEGVTLEDGVFCGPSCVFTNVANPRAEIERKAQFRETRVRRGATIGANATIVCGHTLGEYCFIAAGAVVARDVPDFALMAGVPAKRIGWMSHAGARLDAALVCPETGRRYEETAPDRLREIT